LSVTIEGSVGAAGRNRPADVRQIRQRLVELGFTWVTDGADTVGPTLIRTLRLFQAIKEGLDVVAGSRLDGRVDPNGDTLRWLNARNAPRWVRMTAEGPGLVNDQILDESDHHDYGTSWLDETLLSAGVSLKASWLQEHAEARPLVVNDASLPRGGDTPAHRGHETGLVCDLRLPRIDGRSGGITTSSARYDRATMRAQLHALWAQPLVDAVFLNDDTLIAESLCRPLAGHDNHVHVEIRPPRRETGP
jgi:hypothetical protein